MIQSEIGMKQLYLLYFNGCSSGIDRCRIGWFTVTKGNQFCRYDYLRDRVISWYEPALFDGCEIELLDVTSDKESANMMRNEMIQSVQNKILVIGRNWDNPWGIVWNTDSRIKSPFKEVEGDILDLID